MPIYEYTCLACSRRVSLFFRSLAQVEADPACPRCGERRLKRRMSRVWSHASSADDAFDASGADDDFGGGGFEDYGDDFGDGGDDLDPVAFVREAREMAAAMGEPLDDQFESALKHIEGGADPDDVFGELDVAESNAALPDD